MAIFTALKNLRGYAQRQRLTQAARETFAGGIVIEDGTGRLRRVTGKAARLAMIALYADAAAAGGPVIRRQTHDEAKAFGIRDPGRALWLGGWPHRGRAVEVALELSQHEGRAEVRAALERALDDREATELEMGYPL